MGLRVVFLNLGFFLLHNLVHAKCNRRGISLNPPLLLSASKPYYGFFEGHKEKKSKFKFFQITIFCKNTLLKYMLTPDCGWNSARVTFQGRILSYKSSFKIGAFFSVVTPEQRDFAGLIYR